MTIRPLDPIADRPLVDALFREAEDYIRLERGEPPGPEVTDEFFTDTPPGCDGTASARLGLFQDGRLVALAEMAFGYPTATDAYLGLMVVTPAARGTGAGRRLLRHLEEVARSRAMARMFLAVLDSNPRGRTFWEREGFTLALANCAVTLGNRTHVAHRLGKPLQDQPANPAR